MFTYEKFYDHYVVKNNNKILYHVDTEADAKKEIFLLSSENIDNDNAIVKNCKNYTVYHLHSWYSLIDSCTSPKEYIEKAKELGQKAICFTEHGNIYNWFEKKKLCEENGIKYLHGIECYVTETFEEKIRDNWHTILIAKNYDGFVEINNLFYKSYSEDHTYYKHRISLDEFLDISDNVIKISACIQSPLWKMRKSIMNNEENQDRKDKYIKLLKHYDYYEIQYHDFEDQIEFNRFLYKMSKAYNKPLIVGTDTHNISDYKGECRIMLQYGKTDGAWGDSENECDLTYKTYSELIDKFEKQNSLPMDIIIDAIENTNRMADSCDVLEIDTHNKYPYLYGDKDEEVMWKVLKDNYKQKLADGIITDDKAYIDNVKEEMAVFKKTDMIGFMLFMSELMTWAKDNNIATGSARGSVAGSTVAYMSNITDVDPIIWKTIFSRFCNEHRVEIGDIDTDWYEDDRQKIYDYIIDRFGTEKTGYVLAIGTLADKSVIDVLGKAFSLRYAESKGLKYDDVKNNPDNKYNLKKVAEIKNEYDKNPEGTREEYSDLFYYYDGLVGCVVSQSQHPAGIIASPINLIDFCGAFLGKDGQQILPLDMDCCHDAGLVKYDILGLKSVGVIDKTCKLANRHYPKVHEIDFNDQKVYEDMTNDHTAIFQFESDFAGDCLKKMRCKSVFDLSLVNACIRPSGESYRDKLLNKEFHKNPSEIIDKLLENNYGYLCIDENQMVSTLNGYKSIKNVEVGDIVYTQYGISTVEAVNMNGVKKCLEIKYNGNSIKTTADHKILSHRGWVEAQELMVGDCVALRIGNVSNKEYNHDRLRLIGYLIGDGYLAKERNTVYFCNMITDVADDFSRIVKTFNNCETHRRVENNGLDYRIVKFINNSKSKGELNEFLEDIGLHHKLAIEKEVPTFLFELSNDCLKEFMGAYTDTDCCVKNNVPVCVYKTSSEKLKNGIVEIIRLIGYSTNVTFDKNTMSYVIFVNGAKDYLSELYNYSFKIRKCYSESDLHYERNIHTNCIPTEYVIQILGQRVFKKSKISLYGQYTSIQTLQKIGKNYKLPFQLLELINNNIIWVKITDIAVCNELSTVYDLTIKDEHNFTCQGVVVHNCYQEDTIAFLQQICGFSGSDADNVRRAIGRKKVDELNKALPKILDGYCRKSDKPRDIAEEEAKAFLKVIEDASSYQFGYNHSVAYSIMSYLCGYFRYYYPTEFCTSFLNCAKNDDDIFNGTDLAIKRGCTIRNPKFRYSKSEFGCDPENKVIYKGIGSIKDIGKNCGDLLYELKDNHYDSFLDLLKAIKDDSRADKTELDILTKIDFFAEFGAINDLILLIDLYNKYYKSKVLTKDKLSSAELEIARKHCGKESDKQLRDIDNIALIYDLFNLYEKKPTTEYTKLHYELKYLGYSSIVISDADESHYGVGSIETNKYGTVFLNLYHLNDGITKQIKVNRKWWQEYGANVEVGDIIECIFETKNKRRLINNKWTELDEQEETLKVFAKIDM